MFSAVYQALQSNEASGTIAPVYAFLANLQIARAAKAPKLILQNAGEHSFNSTTISRVE